MKRLVVVLGLAGGMLVLGAGVAAAQELEPYLRDAGAAEFSGRQVVVTYWDGDESAAGVYSVAQIDGMTLVQAEGLGLMVGGGKMDSEHGGHGLAVSEWSDWRLSDRYETGSTRETRRLGRPATVVSVLEDGAPRLRMIFDDATGAPLLSEVFDGDGSLYRMAVMVDFDAAAPPMPRTAAAEYYEVLSSSAPVALPSELGGYWRADTYVGPESTIQAFYTDGLFSFSLFRAEARLDAGPFDDGDRMEAADRTYLRLLDPGSVRVFWNASNATFVLVGDLPPDHLEVVLSELPAPERPNVLVRAWRGLFG